MTTFVSGDDLKSGSSAEAKHGNERIPEPDAVDIVAAGLANELTRGLIAPQETIKNGKVDPRARHNFLWSRSSLGLWRRFDIAANKPARKPSRRDLRYDTLRFACQCPGDRRQITFIGYAEMFKALPDTPCTGCGLPVELFRTEPTRQFFDPFISGIKFGDQSS